MKRDNIMVKQHIWTFFYGSFINLDVLMETNYSPAKYKVARLSGYAITIQPLANLVPSTQSFVYGIVAIASHEELARLYTHAEHVLGGVYLPEPVLVETMDKTWIAALCYIAPDLEPKPATNNYIDKIIGPAKHYNFPDWYLQRLNSFRP